MSESNASNVSYGFGSDNSNVDNTSDFFVRRKVVKVFAGSLVMAAAGVSGVLGASNAPTMSLDPLSTVTNGNEVFQIEKEAFEVEYDVRNSYGLIRSVFGGTIGDTAGFYGVARKTIYTWINSEEIPSLQARQIERAKLLESIAKHVRSKLGSNSKEHIKEKVGGISLDDMLLVDHFDMDYLQVWVEGVKRQVESREPADLSFANKLKSKGFEMPYDDDDLEPLI